MRGGQRALHVGLPDRQPARERRNQDGKDDEAEGMRRQKPRVSRFAAGVIGALVIGIACYFVFGGSLPFQGEPFQLKAVFTSETELHIPSPVRIAGVEVGQVTSVERVGGPSSQAAIATMS